MTSEENQSQIYDSNINHVPDSSSSGTVRPGMPPKSLLPHKPERRDKRSGLRIIGWVLVIIFLMGIGLVAIVSLFRSSKAIEQQQADKAQLQIQIVKLELKLNQIIAQEGEVETPPTSTVQETEPKILELDSIDLVPEVNEVVFGAKIGVDVKLYDQDESPYVLDDPNHLKLSTDLGLLSTDEASQGEKEITVPVTNGVVKVFFHAGEISGEAKITATHGDFNPSVSVKIKPEFDIRMGEEDQEDSDPFDYSYKKNFSAEFQVMVLKDESPVPEKDISITIDSGEMYTVTENYTVTETLTSKSDYVSGNIVFSKLLFDEPTSITMTVKTENADPITRNVKIPSRAYVKEGAKFYRSDFEIINATDQNFDDPESILFTFPTNSFEIVFAQDISFDSNEGELIPVIVSYVTQKLFISTDETKFKGPDTKPGGYTSPEKVFVLFIDENLPDTRNFPSGKYGNGVLDYKIERLNDVDHPLYGADTYTWVLIKGKIHRDNLCKDSDCSKPY